MSLVRITFANVTAEFSNSLHPSLLKFNSVRESSSLLLLKYDVLIKSFDAYDLRLAIRKCGSLSLTLLFL